MSSDNSENIYVGNSSEKLPQLDPVHGIGKGYDPIKELMRAIILRTVDDFNSTGEDKEEAIVYMHSTDDEYIFSFYGICKHMGLDPDKTRECIMNTTRKISTRRRAA